MTTNKLVSLVAVAAVLVGLAYISSTRKKVKTPSLAGKPVLEKLDISEIQRVEIGPSGAKKLVLESADSGWVLRSLFGYPADITKLRENLLKLKDLKVGHVAVGKKLDNPSLVNLQNTAGKSMATLRLGAKHMRKPKEEAAMYGGDGYPDGRYVSAAGSDSVFLVNEALDAFDGDPKSWADTQIVSLPSADFTAIELARSGKTVKLNKTNGAWTLDGLGEKEEFDTSKGYGLESALSSLNFNTLADPALTEEQLGMSTGSVFTVTLKNGEKYTAKIGNSIGAGSDRAFKINATFTPVGTNVTENATLAKKVESFNTKTSKWTFVIPSYNAENMTKQRADLIKPKEEPKKEEPKSEIPAVK